MKQTKFCDKSIFVIIKSYSHLLPPNCPFFLCPRALLQHVKPTAIQFTFQWSWHACSGVSFQFAGDHAVDASPIIVTVNRFFVMPQGDVIPTMEAWLRPFKEVVRMGVVTKPHFEMSTVICTRPGSPCHLVFPSPVDPAHVKRQGSGLVGSFPLRSFIIFICPIEGANRTQKLRTIRSITLRIVIPL